MDAGVNAQISNTLAAINETGNFALCCIYRNLLETQRTLSIIYNRRAILPLLLSKNEQLVLEGDEATA